MNSFLNLRAVAIGGSALTVALALGGCGGTENVAGGASPQTKTAPSNETGTSAAKRTVVKSVSSDPIVRHLVLKTADLFASPALDLVVEGTVTAIDYRYVDGLYASTKMTVAVARQRGGVAKEVVVWEAGGYVPVSDFSASDRAKMLSSEKELSGDEVVDYKPYGDATHPEVGDSVLLFLWENPNRGEMEGTYYELGDSFGRFARDTNGDYVRAASEEGVERVLSAENVDSYMSRN